MCDKSINNTGDPRSPVLCSLTRSLGGECTVALYLSLTIKHHDEHCNRAHAIMTLAHTSTCGGGIPSSLAAACVVAGSTSPGSPVPVTTRSPATVRIVVMQYNQRCTLALGSATYGQCRNHRQLSPPADTNRRSCRSGRHIGGVASVCCTHAVHW